MTRGKAADGLVSGCDFRNPLGPASKSRIQVIPGPAIFTPDFERRFPQSQHAPIHQ